MAAEIYAVSGFLGAGKTTLIQKLLKEAFRDRQVVLIENDFGEISVDAALLQSGNVEVKEINSGCICCSLSGDFVKALKDLLDRFHPDVIMIEPSGVGKLSDVVKACSDPHILPLAKVRAKLTVADVKRCRMYLDNFGEFFEDQIRSADVILLSRTGDFPDKVDDAYNLVRRLNATARIISRPWNRVNSAEILQPLHDRRAITGHDSHSHGDVSSEGAPHIHEHVHSHDGHVHEDQRHEQGHMHRHGDHECDCDHDHSAEDCFDTVTIHTKRTFSIAELKSRVSDMERTAKGTILRAKGIVRGVNGYMNLQYLPGDIRITRCAAAGNVVCIIGQNLNRRELCALFSAE